MSPASKYRPDIDGLRAIAVLAVVLYHFGFTPMRGGFVGVDVFFVISGYLITMIIAGELDAGRFTYSSFYERRIRRIFPALFAMLAVATIVGLVVLLPSDLLLLGKSLLATILFGSNLFLWRTSGYFNATSEINPLLHTWSLAVEEQFYLVFPFVLALLMRTSLRFALAGLATMVAVSFLLCVVVQPIRPTATFYLLPFRAWELGVGALLALGAFPTIGSRFARDAISVGAIGLLLGSLFLIPAGSQFPGWMAAFPVIGTALLIHAGSCGGSVGTRLMSVRPLVFLGLISYSLYLWHWPLLVFAKYVLGLAPLGILVVPLLILSLALAYASYRWVETPFRTKHWGASTRVLFRSGALAGAAAGIVGVSLLAADGWPQRVPARIAAIDDLRTTSSIPYRECEGDPRQVAKKSACILGAASAEPTVALWGDSHALAIAPAVDAALRDMNAAGYAFLTPGCPSVLGLDNPNHRGCNSHNESVYRFIAERKTIKTIVLHNFWNSYLNRQAFYAQAVPENQRQQFVENLTVEAVMTLAKSGLTVYLVGAIPGSSMTPFEYAAVEHFGRPPKSPPQLAAFRRESSGYEAVLRRIRAANLPNVRVIAPDAVLCPSEACLQDVGGRLLYRDLDHLSVDGALFIADHMRAEFRKPAGMQRLGW